MFMGTHVLLYSEKAEADRAFLRDVLNFPHVDAGEGWLIFKLPPAELGVHPAEEPPRRRHADNPLLARAFVNRIWALLLGRGLVHPVDRMDSSRPASHPELLDWLADDFAKNGYDVKRLMRTIAGTRPALPLCSFGAPAAHLRLISSADDTPLAAANANADALSYGDSIR